MTGGFFAVLDDIALLLDDAAAITKLSVQKTVPILGDDLAVNAQKSSDFKASREIPVLIKIAKGSLLNKLIILPIIFLLSAFAPFIITPILILGGLYLAYEGSEKIHEYFFHKHQKKVKSTLSEDDKIKSAILTDFILSIEIVVIALGTVINETLSMQIISVSIVALIATIGVYGIVAFIIRLDDMGFYLIKNSNENSLKQKFGEILVKSLPKVIKTLAFIGTFAMLMVAGGIFTHNIHSVHEFYISYLHSIPSILFEIILGFILGYIVLFLLSLVKKKNEVQ